MGRRATFTKKYLASYGFIFLPCPNKCHKSCNKSSVVQLLRKDMEKHKEVCPRRQYECPHCRKTGEYQERITTHLESCPMMEVPCPNSGCKICIVRCNLSKHRQKWPFQIVCCKYETIGCTLGVIRKDLGKHEGDTQQHLQLAINTVYHQQNMLAHLQSRWMPMKYKLTNYDRHKTADDIIYSPAFYTSPGGYKMCICVYTNGDGEGKCTHVSVFTHLMKGENDDHLPWPFTGTVNVKLLNQLENNNHKSTDITFTPDNKVSRVVNEETSSSGWGHAHYIAQSDLGYNAAKNCQYLKDDCLYFRISVDTKGSSKPWLV